MMSKLVDTIAYLLFLTILVLVAWGVIQLLSGHYSEAIMPLTIGGGLLLGVGALVGVILLVAYASDRGVGGVVALLLAVIAVLLAILVFQRC